MDAYRPRFVSASVDVVDRTRVALSPTDGVAIHVRVGDEFIEFAVEQLRVDAIEAAPGHIIPQWTFVSFRLSSKRDEFATIELVGTVERSRPLFTIALQGLSHTDRERLVSVIGALAEARHERTGVTRIIRADNVEEQGSGTDVEALERQIGELRAELSQVGFERDELRRELDDYRREAVALIRQLRERVAHAEAAKRKAQRQFASLELRSAAHVDVGSDAVSAVDVNDDAVDAGRRTAAVGSRPRMAGTRLNGLGAAAMPKGVAGLEILSLHAQGGMAEVYRARGLGSDGRAYNYAVKRILPGLMHDARIREMFVEEARVATCLEHQNIVRVYDLATSPDDSLFLVMEFLEGFDLQTVLDSAIERSVRLPIWLAVQVAREVLRALTYLSERATDRAGALLRLVHRDISPHNVFICADGNVKLTDFGVAKTTTSEQKTQAGVTKGKLGYMSPEQLNGSEVDHRSDLYNVGILLYEMIAGESLFHGDSTAQLVKAMMRNVLPPFAPEIGVPPELQTLVAVALQRERELRPQSAQAFGVDLERIAARHRLDAHAGHIAQWLRDLGLTTAEPVARRR